MLPRQETTRVQVLHILKIVSNIQDYEEVQVETQQYSETMEGALPNHSNICNKKNFTAVLMLKKFSVFSQVMKMADCDQLR